MVNYNKRATVYFDPKIHQILKLRAAQMSQSISEIVNQAVIHELQMDEEDLKAFEERSSESTILYEKMLKDLKTDGKI